MTTSKTLHLRFVPRGKVMLYPRHHTRYMLEQGTWCTWGGQKYAHENKLCVFLTAGERFGEKLLAVLEGAGPHVTVDLRVTAAERFDHYVVPGRRGIVYIFLGSWYDGAPETPADATFEVLPSTTPTELQATLPTHDDGPRYHNEPWPSLTAEMQTPARILTAEERAARAEALKDFVDAAKRLAALDVPFCTRQALVEMRTGWRMSTYLDIDQLAMAGEDVVAMVMDLPSTVDRVYPASNMPMEELRRLLGV